MSAPPRLIHLESNGPAGAGLASLNLEAADFKSEVPVQHAHVFYQDDEIGITVGVWDTTTMQEAFGPYPGDEFVWVLDGSFSMVSGDGSSVLAECGDCVAFRNAVPMSWKQVGYLKKFFITYLDPKAETATLASADGAVIVMDDNAPLRDVTEPGKPVEREHVAFTNDAGNMSVGLWECKAAEIEMAPFSVHEFVRVLAGEATITEADGTAHHVKSGDCFFIPKGTECQWHIPTYIKKYYAQIDAG